MATLQDLVYAVDHQLSVRATVGGIPLVPFTTSSFIARPGILSLKISKSFDSPVPICSIGVNRVSLWMTRGMPVTVDIGYNGQYAKVFTGTLQSRQRKAPGNTSYLDCVGSLYPLFRSIEIAARNVDGLTVQQAIEAILDYVGIASSYRNLTVPSFTLGSVPTEVAILERAPSSYMVQQLMEIDGLSLYENGQGTCIISRISPTPAPVARFFYSTDTLGTARVIDGSDQEDPTFLRTQVVVTGATIIEGTPPDDATRTITATASVLSSNLVQPALPAGSVIGAEFSNPLIDTDAKAVEVAARVLSDFNRVPRRVTITIPGNPLVELGDTIELVFPELGGIGTAFGPRRFIVETLEHNIEDDYSTILGLRGGDELGGSININPLADFSYSLSRQVITDRIYVVATLDASVLSRDPDGTIASYDWSDNQASTGIPATLHGSVITVLVDPAALSGDWIVTLTVHDNDGLTGSISRTLPVQQISTLVQVPSLFVAIDSQASASLNGGENWNDQAPATGCIIVAPRVQNGVEYGIACFGYSDGKIRRTADYLITSPTQVANLAGETFVDMIYDPRNLDVVWALTLSGKLYISTDGGGNFALYKDMADLLPSPNVVRGGRLFAPSSGPSLFVFGGYDLGGGGYVYVAVQPVVPYGPWGLLSTVGSGTGELGADLPGATGINVSTLTDKGDGGGLVMGLKGTGGTVKGLYSSSNIFNAANWKRATGLTAGLANCRYVVPSTIPGKFFAAFDNRDVWSSTDGIAWTQLVNKMPSGVTPNNAAWLFNPDQGLIAPGVYVIAAENAAKTAGLYLTADEFQTINVLRPAAGFDAWPANARGLWVAPGPTIGRTGRVVIAVTLDATVKGVLYRTNSPVWSKTQIASALSASNIMIPRCLSPSRWIIVGLPNSTDYFNAKCVRTTNSGVSFATLSQAVAGAIWQDIAIDANGRWWGLTNTSAGRVRIYYSDDQGDNWTLSYDNTTAGQRPCKIVCHPSDPQRITALGGGSTPSTTFVTIVTVDRGVTWNRNQASAITSADQGHEIDVLMLPNYRLVIVGVKQNSTTNRQIMTSDDNGQTWQFRYNASTDRLLGPVGGVNGVKMFAVRVISGNDSILMSTDQGGTWVALTPTVPAAAATDLKGGIAYDEREDALYGLSQGGSSNEKIVTRLSPALDQSFWNDFSDRAIPVGAYTSLSVADYARQIAIVPGS